MMYPYILISLLLLEFSNTAHYDGYRSYKNYKCYEIMGNGQAMDTLLDFSVANFDIPIQKINKNVAHLIVAPDLVSKVEMLAENMGLITKILINDYSKVIVAEKENPVRGMDYAWTVYHDLDDIYRYLYNMSARYPGSAKVIVAGHSFEGRQILGLRINTPSLEKKPAIVIESGIHAREWIAPAATTYFINQLLTSHDKSIVDLRDDFDWHILPCVNPDGYQFTWTHKKIGEAALRYGFKVNNAKYDGPVTAADVLYRTSGASMDWVRRDLNTSLVFTFELRGSQFAWPKERIPEQGDEVTQMLLGLVTEARHMGYFD